MICFKKVAVVIVLGTAQVYETDSVSTGFEHFDDVIIQSAAETAGAETDAVGRAV